jgi:hypothetical protein
MGGRRRRSVKKSRKMRGGNFYGFGVDPQIGSAGAAYPSVENLAANSASGRLIPNNAELNATQLGGRRRRRTRKGGRKSRKVGRKGRKTMRGGANFYSPATAGGSFVGSGSAGLINLKHYDVNVPPGGPAIGADGVSRTS